MFRKIAEWLTGHKRREDTHPMEYVNNREERKEEAVKAAEQPKTDPHFWAPGLPAVPAYNGPPEPVKEQAPTQQPPVESTVAVSNTEPWPFPKAMPEAVETVQEVKPKRTRKPRAKKVI
jgi:hypothetical protein